MKFTLAESPTSSCFRTCTYTSTMEALGLPASFGKPSAAATPPSNPGNADGSSSRGGPPGRGPRGVVGGGKRGRGKGRGGLQARSEAQTEIAGQPEALNEGIKVSASYHPSPRLMPQRPHPSSAKSGRISDSGWGGRQEALARGDFRGGGGGGGEGRGGSSRGRGDFGAKHDRQREPRPRAEGDAITGFYMDSFVEDPWKSLLEAKEEDVRGT